MITFLATSGGCKRALWATSVGSPLFQWMALEPNTAVLEHNGLELRSSRRSDVRASSWAKLVELRCVSCEVQAHWAPYSHSGTKHKANLAISLSGWLGCYTNVEYLQSLDPKRRGQLPFQV